MKTHLRPGSSKVSFQKVLLFPFHCKPRPSGVSLVFPGLEYIPRFREIESKLVKMTIYVRQTRLLLLLKRSGAIFRPRTLKVSLHNVLLCQFQCKARRSGVSLESPGLESIPQVPRNRSENGQNHDARKAISATLTF